MASETGTFLDFMISQSKPDRVARYEFGCALLKWNAFNHSVESVAELCQLDEDMFFVCDGWIMLDVPAEIANSPEL